MGETDFKELVDDPPAHLKPLAHRYRNALAKRQQAQALMVKLSNEVNACQRTLLEASGAEAALKQALVDCATLTRSAGS